jgi:hypothetical protein
MRKVLHLLFVMTALASMQCRSGNGVEPAPVGYHAPSVPARHPERVSIQQGVWGDVWFLEGNFMPTQPSGTTTAVRREMRIYELTSLADVELVQPPYTDFFSRVHTRLVARTWSDADGFFQLRLSPGTYSLFAVENGSLYANSFGDHGISPVEVKGGAVTPVLFRIDYRARY